MRRPVVTVTIRNEQGDVLHSEKRSAFNAGIRASEDAIREIARAAHTTYEADRPSRVGDVYTRRWVSRDGRAIVATIEKEPETAMEARKTSPEPDPVEAAHKAGADYAHEQLAGSYFQDWVWEQMVEAERMRQADPNSVIDASTPAGARKVAKNMLQQLKWDTKRALKESKEFFEGFDEVLQSQSSIDWLADMILDFDKEARERGAPEAREAYGRRGRRSGGDVPRYKRDEEEWQRRRSEYQAKVEPLKTGLVRIVGGDELLRRGIQIPTSGVIVASLSDPRKYNEPVAHFRQYPDFGYGEDGGIGTTYYVEPALVPAGKETRETYDLPRAKQHRKGVDYYETASDAQKVRNHILPQYPEARVVRYELGWAVQLYKSGPYYRRSQRWCAGQRPREAREAGGRCQLAWSRTTQASTATGAKGLFKVESKPDGWYVTLDGGKLGVYAERKGAERAAERFEADESIPARREAAEAPAGKETREAREAKRTPTSTMYQEAQVFINGRFQVGFTFTPSRGPEAAAREVLSLTRDGDIIEVKQGQEVWTYKVAGKGNAKRLVTVRETREAYGRRGHRRGGDDRPVTPYYSRKR